MACGGHESPCQAETGHEKRSSSFSAAVEVKVLQDARWVPTHALMQGGFIGTQLSSLRNTSKADQGSLLFQKEAVL